MYKVLTVSDAALLLPVTDDVEYSPSNRTTDNTRQATIAINLQAIFSIVLYVMWITSRQKCHVFIFFYLHAIPSLERGGANCITGSAHVTLYDRSTRAAIIVSQASFCGTRAAQVQVGALLAGVRGGAGG